MFILSGRKHSSFRSELRCATNLGFADGGGDGGVGGEGISRREIGNMRRGERKRGGDLKRGEGT